jgi:hypothetical protein
MLCQKGLKLRPMGPFLVFLMLGKLLSRAPFSVILADILGVPFLG